MLGNPEALLCLLGCRECRAKSHLKRALGAFPCATAQEVHGDITFHSWFFECESEPAC